MSQQPDQPHTESPPPAGRVAWRRLAVGAGLDALSVLAIAMWCGPRDSIRPLAVVFYALPPAVGAGLAVAGWCLLRKHSVRRWRVAAGWVLGVQLLFLGSTWQWSTQEPQAWTLGFWNVCETRFGRDGLAAQIDSWQADLIGLAESQPDDPDSRRDMREFWRQRFPDYHQFRFPRGMLLLSRFPGRVLERGRLGTRSNYGIAELEIGDASVTVVMADLLSGPTLPRAPAFDRLWQRLREIDGPVVLLGDMNTPVRSASFDGLRADYSNAFEVAGRGFYHTWPVPLPVLSLDQVWFSRDFRIGSCRLEWTRRSDHKPVVCTFGWR